MTFFYLSFAIPPFSQPHPVSLIYSSFTPSEDEILRTRQCVTSLSLSLFLVAALVLSVFRLSLSRREWRHEHVPLRSYRVAWTYLPCDAAPRRATRSARAQGQREGVRCADNAETETEGKGGGWCEETRLAWATHSAIQQPRTALGGVGPGSGAEAEGQRRKRPRLPYLALGVGGQVRPIGEPGWGGREGWVGWLVR